MNSHLLCDKYIYFYQKNYEIVGWRFQHGKAVGYLQKCFIDSARDIKGNHEIIRKIKETVSKIDKNIFKN